MTEVTQILSQIADGDPSSAERLLPLVYDELRKLAAAKLVGENPGHTLQATALVHESYLRLVDVADQQQWRNRGHFFGAAAEAMRRILINHARDKAAQKRGGDWNRVSLDAIFSPHGVGSEELMMLNEALEQLADQDPHAAEVANLRIFAGLSIPQIAEATGLGRRTVDRLWAFSRAWIRTQLREI